MGVELSIVVSESCQWPHPQNNNFYHRKYSIVAFAAVILCVYKEDNQSICEFFRRLAMLCSEESFGSIPPHPLDPTTVTSLFHQAAYLVLQDSIAACRAQGWVRALMSVLSYLPAKSYMTPWKLGEGGEFSRYEVAFFVSFAQSDWCSQQ